MVTIQNFDRAEQDFIKKFVLDIQNNEFHLGLTEEDQPELKDIAGYFKNGGFWTAKIEGKIIGTIGLQYLDNDNSALKKMFVNKAYRGRELGIAQMLFDTLMEFAKVKNFKTIWLDTPAVATASHKFYERNGFIPSEKSQLPDKYTFPDRDFRIYKLNIRTNFL
jgi:GNAT superfamily N-acetyltransferase